MFLLRDTNIIFIVVQLLLLAISFMVAMLLSKKLKIRFVIIVILSIVFFLLSVFILDGYETKKLNLHYTGCQQNLKKLGERLERFKKVRNSYPKNLSELVSFDKTDVPQCLGAATDSYSKGYEVSRDFQKYSLTCKGFNHRESGITANYPRYYSKYGLIIRKEYEPAPSPTHTKSSTPTIISPTPKLTPSLIKEN